MIIDKIKAVQFLKEGKVVALPTETVYGLGADALNPEAIAKIFEVKNRPADNPLICHFNSIDQVRDYVLEIPETTERLMRQFSPGPISFMLDLASESPLKFATCGSSQLIARIPDHSLFLEVIEMTNIPIAAPSANTSGRVSPTSAIMVENDLGSGISGILDGGDCKVGVESSIVDARNEKEIMILRPGAIGEREMKEIIRQSKFTYVNAQHSATTPGSKYKHYAPVTPLILIDNIETILSEYNTVLLITDEQYSNLSAVTIQQIAEKNNKFIVTGSMLNLNDLAKNLYKNLAAIDELRLRKAFFLKSDWGDSSLGKTLENRLSKIIS